MKYSLTILLLTIFIFSNCAEQRKLCKPEKKVRPIKFRGFVKATVDYILKEGDSIRVFVKKRRSYNNPGWDRFSATFPMLNFPDSIKIGATLNLITMAGDTCGYIFRAVK
jgi:hypothetical protein